MDVLERLKDVFNNVADTDYDLDSISENTHLFDELGMNSIGILYIALAIEEEFGISFSNDDFPRFQTVGDITSFIAEQSK